MSGLGEMGNLLKQAQEMQRQMDRVRGELHSKVVEGTAGGGVVRISLSADRQEVKDVTISQEILVQNDPTLLNDLNDYVSREPDMARVDQRSRASQLERMRQLRALGYLEAGEEEEMPDGR